MYQILHEKLSELKSVFEYDGLVIKESQDHFYVCDNYNCLPERFDNLDGALAAVMSISCKKDCKHKEDA